MLTQQEVEDIFSRSMIPPPKDIYIMENALMGQGDGPYSGRGILGLHKMGVNEILLPSNAPKRTLFHETTHNVGFVGETIVRTIAAIATFRNNHGIGNRIMRRRVSYNAEYMQPGIAQELLASYGLDGDTQNVKIIHLTLNEQ